MTSINDIRAGLAVANERTSQITSALEHARNETVEVQQVIVSVTEGSVQSTPQDVLNMYAQAMEDMSNAQQLVLAARSDLERFAASL